VVWLVSHLKATCRRRTLTSQPPQWCVPGAAEEEVSDPRATFSALERLGARKLYRLRYIGRTPPSIQDRPTYSSPGWAFSIDRSSLTCRTSTESPAPVFHSAWWDQSVDLRGTRVALIGAGASGFQIGPAVVDQVERLVVFLRTPQLAMLWENTMRAFELPKASEGEAS
jgi:hypothetical protein